LTMEEEVTPSSEYIKGFNDGYVLAQEIPDLAKSLSKIETRSDRLSGFKDGKKQYILEKLHEQRDKLLDKSQSRNNAKEPDRTRDKDDIDLYPER
jgi:hypothetical protein